MLNPTLTDHGGHISGLIAGAFGVGVHPGAWIDAVPLNADSTVATSSSTRINKWSLHWLVAHIATRVANLLSI